MKFFYHLILTCLCLLIISCGNKKPNTLPEGVISKSECPFPPNKDYEYQ